jgi:hypothetical protein
MGKIFAPTIGFIGPLLVILGPAWEHLAASPFQREIEKPSPFHFVHTPGVNALTAHSIAKCFGTLDDGDLQASSSKGYGESAPGYAAAEDQYIW